MSLSGKSVVVVGGSRGIGFSVAEYLLSLGAKVAIASRSQKACDEAKEKLSKTGGQVLAIAADVCSDEQLKNLFSKVNQAWGPLHGLVSAAGVYGSIGKFKERPFSEWQQSIEINLIGVARSVFYALPVMQKDSRIVLFSGGGQGPMPHFSSYVTSKGGLWRLTETLGAELAKDSIYLNAIAPGAINTVFLDDLLKAGPERVGEDFYQKSLKQKQSGGESPMKAAKLVEYLLSAKSTGLSGRTLSAIWDPYEDLKDLESLSKSDLFTYKRVVRPDGGTKG